MARRVSLPSADDLFRDDLGDPCDVGDGVCENSGTVRCNKTALI